MMKKGFTLLEVLLSVAVMSSGVLSVVILYSLGFRESRQSREDVASAAYADAVMSPLISAASSTNLKWSVFRDIGNYPGDGGWGEYYDNDGRIVSGPDSKAQSAFTAAFGKLRSAAKGSFDVNGSFPTTASGGLKAGLIVMHEEDSPIIRIGFRAARNVDMLMSAPLYYTEVCFCGIEE